MSLPHPIHPSSGSPEVISSGPHIAVCAMAGGLGWGIRGQYGHETGAMMAALLVAMTLGLRLMCQVPPMKAVRALAMAVLATGLGGTMTYGQTLGLTQDAPLIGRWDAWAWGMTGVFIKGGLWIAFFGLFLGIGLSRKIWLTSELAVLAVLSVFAMFIGVALLNEPFNPAEKILPRIYFSDHWMWEPDAELKPRRESWGGLLAILLLWITYARFEKKDGFPIRLALAGFISGALGFFLGQCLQSMSAWNPQLATPFKVAVNWWNVMETTFGFVWGGGMAWALHRFRKYFSQPVTQSLTTSEFHPSLRFEVFSLIAVGLAILVWNFGSFHYFDNFADLAWTMLIIPLICISSGRIWPIVFLTVLILCPIALKTFMEMCVQNHELPIWSGVLSLLIFPLSLVLWLARALLNDRPQNPSTVPGTFMWLRSWAFASITLVWVYHALNFFLFRYPWPWAPWTYRTPNEMIFLIFSAAITWVCWRVIQRSTLRAMQDIH